MSFNQILAASTEQLIARRRETIELLRTALAAITADFPRTNFSLDLTYQSSPAIGGQDLQSVPTGWTRSRFDRELDRERRAQRPLLGPHRDRIDILFNGQPVAEKASAGERKAIGLLLLAAQAQLLWEADRSPVLMIDDVDTELDQSTLESLWPLLTRGSQTLFSSNRKTVFSNLPVTSSWTVHNGSIEQA